MSIDRDELTEEDRLLLIKMGIQKRVERHTRTQARYLMVIFAIAVMIGGTALTPPVDVVVMIIILVFCFGVIPTVTVISMYAVIKYRTRIELKRYLEGEGL